MGRGLDCPLPFNEGDAMRLFEFVPIYDLVVNGESLIDRAFGPDFCIVDETGHLLTTTHNQNLLLRAKALIEQHNADEHANLRGYFDQLRDKAETVMQHDYDMAVHREIRDCEIDHTYDFSLRAGGLL
jgi:hypothetical protein